MGCNCGAKAAKKATYVVTFSDGTKKSYNSEIEAKAAAARKGGRYSRTT